MMNIRARTQLIWGRKKKTKPNNHNQFSFLYLLCLQRSMKIKPQNVIGARGRRQLIRPSAALINTTNSRRRLRRSNSVAKQIAT